MEEKTVRSISYESLQIEISADETTLDQHVKNVLAIKPFLARIIKGTVSEVRDYSEKEIEAMIEGTPEVGKVPVDPGATNHPKITGLSNEDNVPFEGEVRYDVLTYIVIPADMTRVKILINVEGQKNTSPGYDLVTRGIYYGARRISAQKGTEFTGSSYDDIKKVYSIWICFDSKSEERNTITEYSITKNNIYGRMPDTERYDLMSVVFIRLGGVISDYDEETLQSFLMYLFSESMTFEEKKKTLSEKYGIRMTGEEQKEVEKMCNYSAGIAEKYMAKGVSEGISQGLSQGISQGISQGTAQERINSIKRFRLIGTTDEDFLKLGYTEQEIELSKK